MKNYLGLLKQIDLMKSFNTNQLESLLQANVFDCLRHRRYDNALSSLWEYYNSDTKFYKLGALVSVDK